LTPVATQRLPRLPFLGAFGWRLFLSLALLSLLLSAVVGYLGYREARSALRAEAMSHMEGVARERRARLESWFEERVGDVVLLGTLIEDAGGWVGGERADLAAALGRHLGRQQAYRRFFVVDRDGRLVASAGEKAGAGDTGPSPEAAAAMRRGEPVLGPVAMDADGDPVMRLSAPLLRDGEPLGAVVAVMRPGETIQPILSDTTGLGRTGETYLVGADTLMLTPSRHMNHPPALTHKMPTPGVLAALAGGSGTSIYRGYLGEGVLGAYEWLPRQRWVLLAEIQTREAFAPLAAIARQTALLGLAALGLALLLSVALSRRMSRPLAELALASERVAAGDLAAPALPSGPGEIGQLAERFRGMVRSLASSSARRGSWPRRRSWRPSGTWPPGWCTRCATRSPP
jgi:HAMP domain-containing protein